MPGASDIGSSFGLKKGSKKKPLIQEVGGPARLDTCRALRHARRIIFVALVA